LIYPLLFKIFVENEVNLNTLELEIFEFSIFDNCKCFNNIFELILKNPNFIRNIRNFSLYFGETITIIEKFYPFLKFLSSNCNSITSFSFGFICDDGIYYVDDDNYDMGLIEETLSQIINSQQNLKKISLCNDNDFKFYLDHLILSLKNPNFSNKRSQKFTQYISEGTEITQGQNNERKLS